MREELQSPEHVVDCIQQILGLDGLSAKEKIVTVERLLRDYAVASIPFLPGIPVETHRPEGGLIKRYKSVEECAHDLGLTPATVRNYCNGRFGDKTTGKFIIDPLKKDWRKRKKEYECYIRWDYT